MAEPAGVVLSPAFARELRAFMQKMRNVPTFRDQSREKEVGVDDRVVVINDSGESIPPYSVMRVKEYVTSGDLSFVKVEKPSTTFSPDYLFNDQYTLGTSGAEKIGFAQKGPNYLVRYDSGTPAIREGWGIKPGQFTLSKGYPGGIRVRGNYDTTAKLLSGEFLPITTLLGKSTGSIAPGSTTSYRIYGGTAGSEADLGWTTVPTAYNRTGTTIASGKWVQLEWINNTWYILPWEC